jgi:hypothetical protein
VLSLESVVGSRNAFGFGVGVIIGNGVNRRPRVRSQRRSTGREASPRESEIKQPLKRAAQQGFRSRWLDQHHSTLGAPAAAKPDPPADFQNIYISSPCFGKRGNRFTCCSALPITLKSAYFLRPAADSTGRRAEPSMLNQHQLTKTKTSIRRNRPT